MLYITFETAVFFFSVMSKKCLGVERDHLNGLKDLRGLMVFVIMEVHEKYLSFPSLDGDVLLPRIIRLSFISCQLTWLNWLN